MDSCGGSGAAAEVGPSAGGAIDDAMRLLAGVVFFADGLFGLCAAVFAGVFEDVFLAGVGGVADGGASAGLEAVEVSDFLVAVLAGPGAVLASEDFFAGAFLLAAFLAVPAELAAAGAGAVSGFAVVADDDAFARELIFSANDFLEAGAPRGAATGLAFGDA